MNKAIESIGSINQADYDKQVCWQRRYVLGSAGPSHSCEHDIYKKRLERIFLQIWYKRSLGLKDELSTFWWLKVKVTVTSQNIHDLGLVNATYLKDLEGTSSNQVQMFGWTQRWIDYNIVVVGQRSMLWWPHVLVNNGHPLGFHYIWHKHSVGRKNDQVKVELDKGHGGFTKNVLASRTKTTHWICPQILMSCQFDS